MSLGAECRVRHGRRAGIRHLQEKIQTLREQMRRMEAIREELKQQPDGQLSHTPPTPLSDYV